MGLVEGLAEEVEGDRHRLLFLGADVLEGEVAFELDFFFGESWGLEDFGGELEEVGEVGGDAFEAEEHVVSGGVGAEACADGFDAIGDFVGVEAFGAFGEDGGEEVKESSIGGGFPAATRSDEETGGDDVVGGVGGDEEGDAVAEGVALDGCYHGGSSS